MRTVIALAAPVAAQGLLMAALSLVDQLMVGRLGATAVAAAGIGAQVTLLVTVVVTALATACGAYTAQHHATGRHDQLRGVLLAAGGTSILLALPLVIVGVAAPGVVMRPFTPDPALRAAGGPYMRLVCASLLPTAATIVCTGILRSTGRVRLPLAIATGTIVLNLLLDWALIFGHLTAPRLGLAGAGTAALAARSLEAALAVILTAARLERGPWRWPAPAALRAMAATAAPQVLTELLWVASENTYTAVYGHLGTQALAAMALTYPLQSMIFGLFGGLAAAAVPLLGPSLAQGDPTRAQADALALIRLSTRSALAAAACLAVLAPHYVALYRVPDGTAHQALLVLRVLAVYLVAKVANQVISGGILPAGADSRFQLANETLATWLVGVPIALTCGALLHLPLWIVYGLLSTEELLRLTKGHQRVTSGRWMAGIAIQAAPMGTPAAET